MLKLLCWALVTMTIASLSRDAEEQNDVLMRELYHFAQENPYASAQEIKAQIDQKLQKIKETFETQTASFNVSADLFVQYYHLFIGFKDVF